MQEIDIETGRHRELDLADGTQHDGIHVGVGEHHHGRPRHGTARPEHVLPIG